MKNLLRVGLVALLSGLCLTVNAQDVVFKVLASKGEVSTKTAEGGQKLTIGKKLGKTDVIEVSNGSYIGLMHKNGKTVELKQPGTYKVADLEGKLLASANSSVSAKYANYVFGEMAKGDDKDMKKNHQQYMAVTGAVMRGSAAVNNSVLKCYIPNTHVITNNEYHLAWSPIAGVAEYTVEVSDMYNETVYSENIKDTTSKVNFGAIAKLKNENMCMVKVYAKNNHKLTSTEYPIKLMSTDQVNKVSLELTELSKDHDANSAVAQIARGMFFEEKDLWLDAMSAYKKAIELEPGVEDYRVAYAEFLKRTGIEKEAVK